MSNSRTKILVLCAAFYLAVFCRTGLAQDSQPVVNVTGRWSILSVSAFGEEGMKSVEFIQQGDQLRGYFKGTRQSGAISGFLEGDRIFFTTATRFVLNFRGKVEGNTISGTFGVRGRRGTWTATRFGTPPQGE